MSFSHAFPHDQYLSMWSTVGLVRTSYHCKGSDDALPSVALDHVYAPSAIAMFILASPATATGISYYPQRFGLDWGAVVALAVTPEMERVLRLLIANCD